MKNSWGETRVSAFSSCSGLARVFFPCLLALVLLATGVFAQERFGELRGEATDQSGAMLPNAKVTARNQATNRTFETQTGGDGSYIIRDVDPGRYTVSFEASGFTRYQVPEVLVTVGRSLTVNAKMQVGGTEQTVQVTEAAPLIDVSGTMVAHNVLAEEFDRLPKARSFQSLVITAPSVNSGEIEGGFQVNGASGAENQFNIDGVSTTSLVNGRSRQNAVFEILQEVQVKTAGIDAEYGGALGGVISAITKSGGNAFHGDLHYYYYGTSIEAGPTRRLVLDPRTQNSAYHVQDNKGSRNDHEVGYSVGGRIIRDKLFFFSAASPRFRNGTAPYLLTDGRIDLTTDRTYHQVFNKLSFNPWQRVRGSVQWLWTPTRTTGLWPSYNGNASEITTNLQSAKTYLTRGTSNPQNNYSGQVDFTLSNTTMLTVRGGRFWDDYKTIGIPQQVQIEWGTSSTSLTDLPANLRQPVGYNNVPRAQNTYWDLTTRTYGQADFSMFGSFLGQHNLKTGWSRSKTVNNTNIEYPYGGYVRLMFNTALNRPTLGGAQRGTYGYYEVNDIATRGSTGALMDSLYIQDQWRIIPRLTLTLGLRTENETVPSFRRELALAQTGHDYAFHFGFQDKLAPRVGASFDVFGDGRLKLFGSFGRYYDWVKYELSRGTFGGDIWQIYYRSLDTTDVFSISRANMPGRDIWNGTGTSFRDRRVVSFDIAEGIKPMGQDLYNAGAEFQLASNTVVRTSYVHTKLLRTIEDLGALDANGDEVYLFGNPGEGVATKMPGNPATGAFPMPKPRRTYDALEVSLTRRFSNGFFFNANYVLSRLYGNYAGIANSDEITSPSTGLVSTGAQGTSAAGRQGGNANRSWDLDEILFTSRGELDFQGRLATDRPHVFKMYGSKDLKWTSSNVSELGLFFYIGSGTPLTTGVYTANQIPVMANGRGDLGRTPVLNYTDLLLAHEFRMGEVKRLRFEFNALNLFNQKTSRGRFTALNRGAGVAEAGSAINLHDTNLFKGYDYRTMLSQTPDALSGRGALDARYGLDDMFNNGFQGRFGVKFTF
jgi:hypothetical protein